MACQVGRYKMPARMKISVFVTSLLLMMSSYPVAQVRCDAVEHDSIQQYVTYYPGNFPLILTAPHGGDMKPEAIPQRQDGCLIDGACVYRHNCGATSRSCKAITIKDSYTKEIALAIADKIYSQTGKRPHVIINELHRSRLDANRELPLATLMVPDAVHAYTNYTLFIEKAKLIIASDGFSEGLLVDLHGQTHSENWVELGYSISGRDLDSNRDAALASVSIGALLNRKCAHDDVTCRWRYVRGDKSFGAVLRQYINPDYSKVRVVPSPETPRPDGGSYFSGGHTTQEHGSRCGEVDAIQMEMPRSIRFGDSDLYANAAAAALVRFVETNYQI